MAFFDANIIGEEKYIVTYKNLMRNKHDNSRSN